MCIYIYIYIMCYIIYYTRPFSWTDSTSPKLAVMICMTRHDMT